MRHRLSNDLIVLSERRSSPTETNTCTDIMCAIENAYSEAHSHKLKSHLFNSFIAIDDMLSRKKHLGRTVSEAIHNFRSDAASVAEQNSWYGAIADSLRELCDTVQMHVSSHHYRGDDSIKNLHDTISSLKHLIAVETLSENMIQLTGKLEEFLRKVKVDLENLRTYVDALKYLGNNDGAKCARTVKDLDELLKTKLKEIK